MCLLRWVAEEDDGVQAIDRRLRGWLEVSKICPTIAEYECNEQ